jgi:integrase
VVRLSGRDVYLGRFGTPESHADYRRAVAEWLGSHQVAAAVTSVCDHSAPSGTVNEVVLGYLNFARTYYVKNGRPTGELDNIKHALRPLARMYGSEPAASFGPVALKAVRQALVDRGLSRSVVNARVNRVRRVFRWATENQLVPPSVLHALQAVAPLKRGRCGVREAGPVLPVNPADIEAVVSIAAPPLAAMIRLQLLTGMRPGEVVRMRTCDLDTCAPTWA